MKRLAPLVVLLAAVVSLTASAWAYVVPDPALRLDRKTLEATRYTGWLPVSSVTRMVYQGTFVDGNGSVTEVDMKCWTSDSQATAAGDGFPVTVELATAATGKAAHLQWIPYWTFSVNTNTKFEFIVVHPLGLYLNCGFLAGAGTPGSTDKLSVVVRGEER